MLQPMVVQYTQTDSHLFASSAKRTSGESEVFNPRADSNRLCFKTIRLSLGVLDMSGRGRKPPKHAEKGFGVPEPGEKEGTKC